MEKTLILVLPLLGVVLIGYLAVKFNWLGQAVSDGVGRFAVALAIPLLVFQTLVTSTLPKNRADLWELLGSYYGGALLVFILAVLVARFVFHRSVSEQSTYGTYAINSNVVLLGLPAVILVLGSKWTTLMILVGSHGLIMALLATTIDGVARRKTDKLPGNLWQDLKREVRQPVFIALAAGLLVNLLQVKLPGPALQMIALLAGAAVPCALIAIGGILARLSIGGITQQTAAICAFKLAAFPAAVWAIATYVMSIPASWTWIAVMLATMPITLDPQGKGRGGDASTVALSNVLGGVSLLGLTYIIVS